MEECGKCQKEHSFRIETLEEKMKEGEKTLIEHGKRIEKIDEACKSAHLRLNEIGEQTMAIYKLGVAVENMAEQFKSFASNFKEHEDRLEKLERVPGENAYLFLKTVSGYALAIVIAFVLGKWGIK